MDDSFWIHHFRVKRYWTVSVTRVISTNYVTTSNNSQTSTSKQDLNYTEPTKLHISTNESIEHLPQNEQNITEKIESKETSDKINNIDKKTDKEVSQDTKSNIDKIREKKEEDRKTEDKYAIIIFFSIVIILIIAGACKAT